MLKIDISAIEKSKIDAIIPEIKSAHEKLTKKTGAGNDFLGWVDLPVNYDKAEFARVKAAAAAIQKQSQVLLVIGIGGSYLGSRAVIEALKGSFYNLKKKNTPDVLFVGNNLSASYVEDIISLIDGRDFSINVISKSGTTTEPAVAFRVFKQLIEERYGKEEAKKRIFATTDKARGALKKLCDQEGYETFVIPDDVGGRYSVYTPVGLLPIAVAGIDIDAMLAGAGEMREICSLPDIKNPAWQYVAARNILYREGKTTEVLATYDPDYVFLAEWFKQLYGESEGKENKGIFPAAISLTADLHSMGQYMQEGKRCLMETVLLIGEPTGAVTVPNDPDNADGLNFLSGKSFFEIEKQACRGTYLAHTDGGVPNLLLTMEKKDERCLGGLLYFFEFACGLSGYTLGVNPFDQPGVEAYKKNMFALLGKPGFEEEGKKLEARLK